MHRLQSSPEMSVFVRGLLPPCPRCGEGLHHHRADDFPTYIMMILNRRLSPCVGGSLRRDRTGRIWKIWLPTTLILRLGPLQPTKGVIAAVQWKLGMHGFEPAKNVRCSVACA